jgi:hypothetical protein
MVIVASVASALAGMVSVGPLASETVPPLAPIVEVTESAPPSVAVAAVLLPPHAPAKAIEAARSSASGILFAICINAPTKFR